jgi:VIT1/CCC1 family predicted Fe2+/Mn2+ transporter
MAIGEWLSVQSARELYGRQISIERQEVAEVPDEEREELSLIYQAKGLSAEAADATAARILADPSTALDTLAREELGLDPSELGGSALQAAGTSFLLFALGAILPVIPFAFLSGWAATITSVALGIVGLFIIGAGVTLTTGAPLWKATGRQVGLGLLAAVITFGLGRVAGAIIG